MHQEIYLVQTKANEENIPDDWVKSGATKVRLLPPCATFPLTNLLRLPNAGWCPPYNRLSVH